MMKPVYIIIMAVFLIACSSEPELIVEPTPTEPVPEPKMIDCSNFFIDVTACRDDHTVVYSITGNAPFHYQFVGLGATPFQDDFKEINTTHQGSIQTGQRLQTIVINPYLDGVMCKEASVQITLDEC
ncbi:hypothetical protein GF345_05325 [Candidatus Woesearchaeota archaeon]|nr:hypothetical protein [Candidatus Woesearchaeota archaeon]